jgi:hypothetical protein
MNARAGMSESPGILQQRLRIIALILAKTLIKAVKLQ